MPWLLFGKVTENSYCICPCERAWAFISYRSFLTWHLNETGVYLGPGVYFIAKEVLWINWFCLPYIVGLQFINCNNEGIVLATVQDSVIYLDPGSLLLDIPLLQKSSSITRNYMKPQQVYNMLNKITFKALSGHS